MSANVMRYCVLLALGGALAFGGGATAQGEKESVRADNQYNKSKKGLALDGYDPVAYFPEGGSKAKKGKSSISHVQGRVTYRFANEKNRDRFKSQPEKYEPAYGGWCAYAMGEKGEKVSINPKAFRVQNGRLFVFYKTLISDTRKSWDKKPEQLRRAADKNWGGLTGEAAGAENSAGPKE